MTPNIVLADPDCWTKHMVNQLADCSKAFLECNLPCGRIGNENTRYGCFESCQKASKLCRDKAAADYRACVRGESTQTPPPTIDPTINPQPEETSCGEIQKILKSKNCPNWVIDPEALQVYCSQNPDELVYIDSEGQQVIAFRNRVPDYSINKACFAELKQKGFESGLSQDQTSTSRKTNQPAKSTQDINGWIKDTFGDVDFERIVNAPDLERKPIIDELPSPALEKARADSPYSAGILKKEGDTRAQIQYPGTKTFVPMKPGKIPSGSVVKSGDDAIYVYDDAVGLVILPPGAEMTISDTDLLFQWHLIKGTVEVKKDNTSSSAKSPGIGTEFVEIDVIGTHYWVSHEPGKQTLVGVYSGQVELKTKGGKTTKVAPGDDKPGVVVVSQKFSPVKLGISGLVLLAIIGGTIYFLRKRFFGKGVKKKK